MKFIWITITMVLGLMLFILVKQHFIWAAPYLVLHMSVITWLKHRGVLDNKYPAFYTIMLFMLPQLLFSIAVHFDLPNQGFDDENYYKALKFNIFRAALIVVEVPLLMEFFKRPKFIRY